MKKKIRADSVDELFEIVKAIQSGEEPEAYTKRKAEERRAEERRLAEERKAEEQRKAGEQKARKQRRAAERRAEKQREAGERRAEEERAAAERRAEEERQAAVRQVEEERAAARRGAGERGTEESFPGGGSPNTARHLAGDWQTEERETQAASRQEKARQETEEDEAFERLLDEDPEEEYVEVKEVLRAAFGGAAERLKEAGSFLKLRFSDAQKKVGEITRNLTRTRAESEEPQEEASPRSRRSAAGGEAQEEASSQKHTARDRTGNEEPQKGASPHSRRSAAGEESPEEISSQKHTARDRTGNKEPQKEASPRSRRHAAGEESQEGASSQKHTAHDRTGNEELPERMAGRERTDDIQMRSEQGYGLYESERNNADTKKEEHAAQVNARPEDSGESAAEEIHSMGRVRLADLEKETAGKTRRRYGANTVSEEAESVGWRILRSLHMESEPSDDKKAGKPKKKETSQRITMTDESSSRDEKPVTSQDGITAADESPVRDEKTVTSQDGMTAADELSAQDEKPGTQQDKTTAAYEQTVGNENEVTDRAGTEGGCSPDETVGSDDLTIAESPAKNGKERSSTSKASAHIHAFALRIRESARSFFGNGFGKKQIAALGAVLVIVILLLSLGISAIRRTMVLHEKQKYVTADAGLTVLVENQPESWCNTWELELKFSVKRGTISTIAIDGVVYAPDESGIVTVTAEHEQLQASVETDEGTLSASIEIPMLDEEAPVLTVEKTDGAIVLSAEDSRSDVQAIWYAVTEEDDWVQLPQYQEYSEPIAWEEGKTYYFYASDQAGNHSTTVVTTMEDAQSLAFEETELSLFPGESVSVQAQVNPSGALVKNIAYDSSDEDVVTISSAGLVTAVADGDAIISASADGVDVATCQVTVASEQTVTISAIGDCTLGSYSGMLTSVSFDTYYSMYGATYFFQNVRDVLANDDATFANLEGPLTDATTAVEKEYAFKGDPSYTEILQDGSIEVVTLANNHSGDYGMEGLEDTKENLTEAGIDYCTGDTIAYQQISGVKVAFIGIYELASGLECESQVRETIAEAQAEGAELIIVAFHWGSEKETAPDETQQSLAHTAIDCGADLVVGHHPHVLQGIEKYNGKYIVYSLGNFCFGGNSNPSDKDTMIFRQTFTITQDGAADDDAIEIIPCTLSSVSDSNDYRPTVATGSAADEIMERINEYSAEFGDITYTASTGL